MRRLLLVVTVMAVTLPVVFAQQRVRAGKTKSIAVAFFDEERLRDEAGHTSMENFDFFTRRIQEIVKRDFPGVEFRILGRGELLYLPDGTGLNVQNLQPKIGFVLSERGRKRRLLSGVQSDTDFACAAAAFFRRASLACPK